MLLLIVYEQWHVIYFLENNFSAEARVRNLYVIALVCVGSSFVVMCCFILICGRQLLFIVLCINLYCFS